MARPQRGDVVIVRIAKHKTVPAIAVVTAGPELAAEMGRFAFARWQPQHKAFWVEEQHLETMTRVLTRDGHTVIDERHRGEEEKFSGALPECRSCGTPASRKAALTLNRCRNCGDAWHPVQYEDPGSAASMRVECPGCGRRQPGGFTFCGECGHTLPAPRAAAAKPVDLVLPGRDPDQEPLPDPRSLADCIDELALPMPDLEEPERERYP